MFISERVKEGLRFSVAFSETVIGLVGTVDALKVIAPENPYMAGFLLIATLFLLCSGAKGIGQVAGRVGNIAEK